VASFTELDSTVPDLAARARAVLDSTTNAVLGTIRRDGTPRLSGIDPFFHGGELHIGSMPGARKGEDLRRDPRIALHSIPWESRRLREGASDPGEADVKLSGTATLVTDRDAIGAAFKTPPEEIDPATSGDLFVVEVQALVVISVADDQLVIERWTTDDGHRVIRRD
jgi:hypothetical protein